MGEIYEGNNCSHVVYCEMILKLNFHKGCPNVGNPYFFVKVGIIILLSDSMRYPTEILITF